MPVLLDAIGRLRHRHPQLHLTLIGDGPDRASLEARVSAEGLNEVVSFLGYRSQDEVAAELARTDVFVLPSFAEGVPVVLMEAMAAQVPVVTTQIAGVPELVEDGTSGRLVPPGDSEALAKALSELLSDPDRRRSLGAVGRSKVSANYDMRKEAAWLSQIIESYANNRHATSKRPEAAK